MGDDSSGAIGSAFAAGGGAHPAGTGLVVAPVVRTAEKEGALACLHRSAQNITAGQVKIGIGGKTSTPDLRRRGRLKGGQALLETGGAIIGRGFETQNGCESTAVNNALT